MPKRAAAIIIKNAEILLMHRIKNGEEYFSFPGGMVEMNELPEAAAIRELKEEFCIDITIDRFLFDMESMGKHGYYYLVTEFKGTPILGGEEKMIMNESNQFYPIWKPVEGMRSIPNLLPKDIRERVADLIEPSIIKA